MANKEDSGSSITDTKIRAYDIAQILQAKYAYMTGGKDNEGNVVITIPLTSKLNNGVSDKDLQKLFNYFTSLQSFFDKDVANQKFTIILDRRKSKWSSVNNSLTKLKKTFPHASVNYVLVLKPQGLFQKIVGGGVSNEEAQAAFKIVVLSNVADLDKYINQEHLSVDLGGKLNYRHEQWIEHRSAIERFDSKVFQLTNKLEMLRRKFEKTEVKSNIDEMEYTLESHREMWKDLKEDIVSTRTSGITILKCIHPNRHKEDGKDGSAVGPDVKANTDELDGLFKRLQDSDNSFAQFWETHDQRIRQGMQLLQFEKEVSQVTGLLLSDSTKISAMVDVGDCKPAAEKLLEELNEFRLICQDHITIAEALLKRGTEMTDMNHLSNVTIEMTSKELKRSCTELTEKIEKRVNQLKTAMDIHEVIDQAGRWCTKGSDLLATQPVEKFQTTEGAEKCLEEIENFLKDRQGVSLKKLNQLDKMSKESENKYLIQKVKNCLKRIGEVNEMMSKRENSLKRMVAKRPVQPVKALQVDTKGDGKRKTSTASIKDSKRKISSSSTDEERKGKASPTPKRLSIVLTDSGPPSPVPLSKNYAKAVSIPDLLDAVDGEDTEEIIKKRMQIMSELVATERDYVQDLNCIIRGYVREFEKSQDKVPDEIFSQKHLIFGNIEEIYRFHNEEFLKELERCVDNPLLVGKVFHEKKDDFELYAVYCKNKPASEQLQQNFTNLPFVKELQSKLGHKLPLTAYLLKPVQRITKYQLLLKEMMKNTRNKREAYINLVEALQSMQGVLRHLNDVMHSRGLRGYHGNLADLGKLLLQESFMVWHVNKRGILRAVKGRRRQVFLYQKMVLFTKKEEDLNSKDVVCYHYKNGLKLSEIGITETVKQDPLKFELWLNKKSEIFILQASSVEEKERWISQVRNVLLSQFDQAKAEQVFKKQGWNSAPNMQDIESSCSNLSFLSLSQERGLDDSSQQGDYDDDFDDGSDSFDSDDSDSQDTSMNAEESAMRHGYMYSVIASYSAVEQGELSIRERAAIEVLRLGNDGWWYARDVATNQEGWVPASYLEPLTNNNSA
ncbi:Guanine nucleotide exchange factor DBS [Exaiptasia diaphana]|nr:Guanine nucleotide exchange factor DBS [Exaiptasia diaphana]